MALRVKKRIPLPHKDQHHELLPQRTWRKQQRKQTVRRITTITLVVLVMAVVGGIVHTWYMGQQRVASSKQAPITSVPRAVFKPPKVASNAKIGVAVQIVSPKVKPGENASITIRTNPEANCTISVKYNKVAVNDSGLAPKVADEFGVASWAWTVAPGAPTGKWPIEIICKNKLYSAVVVSDLVIAP